ncbi:hypothetical protein LR68_01105 [Anoxybacillus sp. BCO1]|nr:hypothetical protein LR68_01105 [Anoxybacillus sp. BCO1]
MIKVHCFVSCVCEVIKKRKESTIALIILGYGMPILTC